MRNLLAISYFSKLVFICSFLTLFVNVSAQRTPELSDFKPRHLKKFAERAEMQGDYYSAIYFLEEAYAQDTEDDKLIYQLAGLYAKSRQYDSAIVFYLKPEIKNDKKFPLRKYELGTVLMIDQQYEEAQDLFSEFRKSYRKHKDSRHYRRMARYYIAGCDSAMNIDSAGFSAYVYNLGEGVNSPHIEFSPYPVSKNEILYGTLPIDSANRYSRSKSNAPVRELKIAKKEGDTWQSLGKEQWGINHPEYNTGNAALSADGLRLYFTRCYQNWKFEQICQIYQMTKESNGWSEPTKLNELINTEKYTATHPAVGVYPRDGADILYFVSNRPEGKGGLDIWFSIYNLRKEEWREPRNAGSRVNTGADDITPYYNTATQTLYFSSTGMPGFGGFDIYSTKGWGRKWEEPVHVGAPVNSSYNDVYLALNPDGNSGFFASNRPGSQKLGANTCCEDIYFFNWKLPVTVPARGKVFQNSASDIVETINIKFNSDIKPVPEGTLLNGVPVYLYQKHEDGSRTLIQTVITVDGNYNFNLERNKNYSITVKNYGFFDKTITATTQGYLSEDTLELRSTGITHIPDFEVDMNIYYESGKSKLTAADETLLDSTVAYLMDMFPSAIIEVGSHTDNIGKESFNQKLSQKRAEEVLKYMAIRGVDEGRLVARGYGEAQPIAPNQFPDGSDNPEGRQKNRRTQIKIIGTLTPDENVEE